MLTALPCHTVPCWHRRAILPRLGELSLSFTSWLC